MRLRKLNDLGILQFREYIDSLRAGNKTAFPAQLLEDEQASKGVKISVEIEQKDFLNRYELGEYLCAQFADTDMQPYLGDCGFWSWIALFYFQQLCPNQDGILWPAHAYNYILSESFRERPRHSIYITWQLVNRYGPEARFLLSGELWKRGEAIDQMMMRANVLSFDGVIRLASELYTDPSSGGFKRGTTSRKKGGSVYRYMKWLKQIENTYDLHLISVDGLKSILPKEFGGFLGS